MTLPSRFPPSLGLMLLVALSTTAQAQPGPRTETSLEFFEKRVRPVLVDNCYNCHSANTNARGGLRVDDRNGLVEGGSSGPAVVPGDPARSLLLQAVRYTDENLKMPPKKRLTAEQVADLERWIKQGAAWPASKGEVAPGKANPKYNQLRKEHWAWQSLKNGPIPQVRNESWALDDVDRFILAKLDEKGLAPVRNADKVTLLRRVTFDLTGLPPTPEEIDAFLKADPSSGYDEVVDRLLASPAFGERWGRHWLDVARFGESTGSSRNLPYPHAWRYRDYVVDAFTRDKPYNQFIREQIAGDLLPAHSQAEREEHAIATGFLAVGVKDVNQRFKVRYIMDNIDEQIDAVSRSVLALTVSCARCHDHKFDPIPTTDYYALAGIFRSTDLCAGLRNKMGGGGLDYYDTQMLVTLGPPSAALAVPPEKIEKAKAAVVAAKREFEKLRDSVEGNVVGPDGRPKFVVARQKFNRLQLEFNALTDPAANGVKVALGVREAKSIGDTEIRIRGEAEKLGPVVPRGFPTVLRFPNQSKVNPSQSGRLELAYWLTSDDNPLTPRVMVNRVWQHLFGQGLVQSVDNFGVTGDVPSHPELLDHLAARFVGDGWSVKRLVRALVLSHAYQLSSDTVAANMTADPANRLVWRHRPRRLDAEEIRDATLAAAGTLDPSRPRGSAAKGLRVVELPNNGPVARRIEAEARASTRRSLYLPLLRGLTPTPLEVFDFAGQGMVTGSRDTTTVATQALFLMNDPIVRGQSLKLAERLRQRDDLDDEARVTLAYRLTLGRDATAKEVDRARSYVRGYETALNVLTASTSQKVEPTRDVEIAQGAGKAPEVGAVDGEGAARTPAKAPRSAAPKKPAPPVNPDEVLPVDEPVKEEVIQASDPNTAAWASFCQALLGTAEFRYLK